MLNFFNKVLISLDELTSNGNECDKESLISHCKSFVSGGILGDYETIIEQCRYCGLLTIPHLKISITLLGDRFLRANSEKYFEFTNAQKQVMIERVVFNGSWTHYARELFEIFFINLTSEKYECSLNEPRLTKHLLSVVHFFKYLGLLHFNESVITVDDKYSELVYHMMADRKAVSEQQLEKMLMENRKLGAKAEKVVVKFEQKRLLKLGKKYQADLVKKISHVDTNAGYDILSFDGITDDTSYNRFIEVKATIGKKIYFYWTSNERNIAKKKKMSYWIYMLRNFKEDKPFKSIPIMIQNPDVVVPDRAFLSMEVNKYIITEIGDVKLKEGKIDELKWFELE